VIRKLVSRNRAAIAVGIAIAVLSSGTAAAVSYIVLGTTNTAGTTTTLRSSVNGTVLQISNTNSTGGTSAKGIGITAPAGRAPIVVNSTAGKATNLNADKLDGIDSTGFVRRPVEGWHEVGTAGQPPFWCWIGPVVDVCPWQNYLGGYNTAGFYKDPLGVVRLKGLVALHGTGFGTAACDFVSVFTLPAGYRPSAATIFASLRNDTLARIDVLASGEVSICATPTNEGDWFSLDGISFRAAP
jgi:hypothetical protein